MKYKLQCLYCSATCWVEERSVEDLEGVVELTEDPSNWDTEYSDCEHEEYEIVDSEVRTEDDN